MGLHTETGEKELKEVLAAPVTETDILVKVVLSDGEQIETTMFHPFYVQREKEASGTWTAASNLVSGDKLLMENGKSVYVESIQIEKLEKAIKVYNLEIEGLHTYYVGNGVLVHNVCTPQEMNKKKAEALEGKDIEFTKLDDALYFIEKNSLDLTKKQKVIEVLKDGILINIQLETL